MPSKKSSKKPRAAKKKKKSRELSDAELDLASGGLGAYTPLDALGAYTPLDASLGAYTPILVIAKNVVPQKPTKR
jgi:hypothetical protein